MNMRYSRPSWPSSGTVWSPALIRSSPCGPIANPPSRRPINPGSPSRLTNEGPEEDHREEHEELEHRPRRGLDRCDEHYWLLRIRGTFAWLPSHFEARLRDCSVRGECPDRRVDDVEIRRALREYCRKALAAAQLAEYVEASRVRAGEAERDWEVEKQGLGSAGTEHPDRRRAVFDHDWRVSGPNDVFD